MLKMVHFSEPDGEALVRGIEKGLCLFSRRKILFSEPDGEALVRGIEKGLCLFSRRKIL
jgi:hypothetical protein